MTTYLRDLALLDITPPSIKADVQVTAIADGTDEESLQIIADIERFLPWIPNLDNLPSRIVDLLAWGYHVDNYDSSAAIAVRRERVRQAVAEHRIHGTRPMVQWALDMIFGVGNATIVEWWQNDPVHAAYTFRVKIHVPFTQDDLDAARTMLTVVSNVRSHWLAYIIWDELDLQDYSWNELDALGLTWDQMDEFYFYAVGV